jgi:hypothetical protein
MLCSVNHIPNKNTYGKAISLVKNQTFVFAQILPNNFAYTEWISAFMQK